MATPLLLGRILWGSRPRYTAKGWRGILPATERDKMIHALLTRLDRGASYWDATGGYTGSPRTIILCTIYRPQVTELRHIISTVDPHAFVSIGITQEVLGSGFTRLDPDR